MVRPKKPAGEALTNVIPCRFTGAQYELVKEAARIKHLEQSAWLRQVAVTEATRVTEREKKASKKV